MKPSIGISLDYVEPGQGFSSPHYALRKHYFDAVVRAGGIPFGLCHDHLDLMDDIIAKLDGLIIPGGDFALEPSWYVPGEGPAYPVSPRLQFDIALIRKAINHDVPLLGICAGMQILAGMHGCKLTNAIHQHSRNNTNHRSAKPKEELAHKLIVNPHSLLHRIVQVDEFSVNSHHSEGVVQVSDRLLISGTTDDGIIEAIELKTAGFAVGVQWHPEYFLEDKDVDFSLFKALVTAAR